MLPGANACQKRGGEMKRKVLGFLAGLVALGASLPALAWDGYPDGVPATIEVAQGAANYSFRVHFAPAVPMCGNGNTWAYLNTTDGNYSTFVAAILMAKAQGTRVTVYSNVDASGYCHIGHIGLH
jgi:hypothetical protein